GNDRPRLAQAHILTTKDNKLVAIHLSSPEKFWEQLTDAFDAMHLRTDPRFATRLTRIENYEDLGVELNRTTAQRDRAEWDTIMSKYDVPFAAVNEIAEVGNDPQVEHMEIVVPVARDGDDAASHIIRSPIIFDGKPSTDVKPAPRLDADGTAIRAALSQGSGWPI